MSNGNTNTRMMKFTPRGYSHYYYCLFLQNWQFFYIDSIETVTGQL
jgi:hypothetical protein